jgi:fatty acid desaturase
MTDYTSANPAQNIQNQNSGIGFILLFSLAIFLAYAVNKGMIVEGFIYLLSYFFDNFQVKIHNNNIIADIALLVFILLALFGLFCFVKFFFSLFITVAIIGVIALAAFYFDVFDFGQQHTEKTKNNEAIERNYAPFGG